MLYLEIWVVRGRTRLLRYKLQEGCWREVQAIWVKEAKNKNAEILNMYIYICIHINKIKTIKLNRNKMILTEHI